MKNLQFALKQFAKTLFHRMGYTVTNTQGRRFPYVVERSFENGETVFDFWITSLVAEINYARSRTRDDPEYYAIKQLVKANKIHRVVEVGAHHGIYTLVIAGLLGDGGMIVAYEADPACALVAQANMALNSISNTRIICKAVGASSGHLLFNTNVGVVIDNSKQPSEAGMLRVPVVSLDEEIKEPIDLLKIDVEGFEAEVLKGAQRLLEARPCLILEIHGPSLSKFGSSFEQVAQIANLHDYEGFIYDNRFVDLEHLRQWDGPEESPNDTVFHLFLSPRQ